MKKSWFCKRYQICGGISFEELAQGEKADLENFFEELELRDESGCAKLLVCRVAAKTSAHPVNALSEAEAEVQNFFRWKR